MERQHDNSLEVERLRKEVSMLREEIGRLRHEEPQKHQDNRDTKTTNSTSTTKLAKNLSGNAYLDSRRKYWREELAKNPLTSTNDVSDKGYDAEKILKYIFYAICIIGFLALEWWILANGGEMWFIAILLLLVWLKGT